MLNAADGDRLDEHAVYPGTFDPITPGHLAIIERARHLFVRVTVLVAVNADKQSAGRHSERAIRLRRELPADWDNVSVAAWAGLTAAFCRGHRAGVIVRGVRNRSDLRHEYQLAAMNQAMGVTTLLLAARPGLTAVSSTAVRGLAQRLPASERLPATRLRNPPGPVTVRPLSRDHFPLLGRWLAMPHVQAWWGTEPVTSADVERKYGPRADGTDPTVVFVIELAGQPVGIIQCYRHADHADWDRAVGVPAAAGIDYLIGEPAHCGHGVGSAAITRFAPQVFARYPNVAVIVAVPQAANHASRRALEKAGFSLVDERQLDSDDPSDAGPSAVYALARPVDAAAAPARVR
jgi:pantetheine-phosphate adenylyltransferase